jgi:hypothetical protein
MDNCIVLHFLLVIHGGVYSSANTSYLLRLRE